MYNKIVITGSVGTGKTTIAKLLAERLKMKVIHVSDFVKKKHIYSKIVDGELIVKMNELKKELNKLNNVILESHLLCEFKLSDAIVIVLRCRPEILEERLKKRAYSEDKIRENLEAEALDYCSIKAVENYGDSRVYEIDVSNLSPESAVEEILKILSGKRKSDEVDFSGYLLRE